VVRTEDKRKADMSLVKKPEGYEPAGRPRFRWKENAKMYHKNTMGGL
jgi:hypothetical protein